MASITEQYTLNRDTFEAAIAVGRLPHQMLAQFNVTEKEMDEFCLKNYGRNFKLVHEWVRQCTIDEWLHTLKLMGVKGNPTAMQIVDKAIQKDESMGMVKIVFDQGSVKQETEEDKMDDGKE